MVGWPDGVRLHFVSLGMSYTLFAFRRLKWWLSPPISRFFLFRANHIQILRPIVSRFSYQELGLDSLFQKSFFHSAKCELKHSLGFLHIYNHTRLSTMVFPFTAVVYVLRFRNVFGLLKPSTLERNTYTSIKPECSVCGFITHVTNNQEMGCY